MVDKSVITALRVNKRLKAKGIVGRADEMCTKMAENLERVEYKIEKGRQNALNMQIDS